MMGDGAGALANVVKPQGADAIHHSLSHPSQGG